MHAAVGPQLGYTGNAAGIFGVPIDGADFLPDNQSRVDPDVFRKLTSVAIDAAKEAGARYADVRLTRTSFQAFYTGSTVSQGGVSDNQYAAAGVRVLIDNSWGFASSSVWSADELAKLARSAAHQARANSKIESDNEPVILAETAPVTGVWQTPIRIDPFTIPVREKIDFMTSWMEFANHVKRGVGHSVTRMSFKRQESALATTDGTFVIQTRYQTGGEFPVIVANPNWRMQNSTTTVFADGLEESAKGWELFLDAKLPEQMPGLIEEGEELLGVHMRPFAVGRYEVVFDAAAVAQLFDRTIGVPIEPDRILGLEVNSGGSSFLPSPLGRLKNYRIASQLLSVKGNRSMKGGLATVKWDDEGVEPAEFDLVSEGVIGGFPCTREQAAWLQDFYGDSWQPVSNGCCGSDSAMRLSMQHAPNYEIQPAATDVTFDDLIKDTKHGIAVLGGSVNMDFQGRSGTGSAPVIRQITNGKMHASLVNLGYMLDMPSFWRGLVALGGKSSVRHMPMSRIKGEPLQGATHTVSAVPAKFRNVAAVDMLRRL